MYKGPLLSKMLVIEHITKYNNKLILTDSGNFYYLDNKLNNFICFEKERGSFIEKKLFLMIGNRIYTERELPVFYR